MIKKKFLFIPLLVMGLIVTLLSCNDLGDGRNYQTYESYAIVDYNSTWGTYTLLTGLGELAANVGTTYMPGDCLALRFTIDFDNQPSTKYYTASELVPYVDIENRSLRVLDKFYQDEYTYAIEGIDDLGISPFFNGVYFLKLKYKESVKNQFTAQMFCVKDSLTPGSHIVPVYFKSKENGTSTSATKESIHAFDIKSVLSTASPRDTTIQNVKYTYLELKPRYYVDEKDGEPVWNNKKESTKIYFFKEG